MTASFEAWDGSTMTLPGGVVLLSPDDARAVLVIFELYLRNAAARDGGGSLAGQAGRIRATLAASVSMTRKGHEDVPTLTDSQTWVPVDLITTKEAAELLEVGHRQARRYAKDGRLGTVHHAGRSHLVSRAEVVSFKAEVA